jgi:hypothetical protein
LTGGTLSLIGFVASITIFPAKFSGPARFTADSAAVPLTQRTTISPYLAASAKLPSETFFPECFSFQEFNFSMSEKIIRTEEVDQEMITNLALVTLA